MKLFKVHCEYPKQPKIRGLKGYLCGFDNHMGEPHLESESELGSNYTEVEIESLRQQLEGMGFKVKTHPIRTKTVSFNVDLTVSFIEDTEVETDISDAEGIMQQLQTLASDYSIDVEFKIVHDDINT